MRLHSIQLSGVALKETDSHSYPLSSINVIYNKNVNFSLNFVMYKSAPHNSNLKYCFHDKFLKILKYLKNFVKKKFLQK